MTQAEGKSGTLFEFEPDLDVTKIETTNVMAKNTVKVCTRHWYEGKLNSFMAKNGSVRLGETIFYHLK